MFPSFHAHAVQIDLSLYNSDSNSEEKGRCLNELGIVLFMGEAYLSPYYIGVYLAPFMLNIYLDI